MNLDDLSPSQRVAFVYGAFVPVLTEMLRSPDDDEDESNFGQIVARKLGESFLD